MSKGSVGFKNPLARKGSKADTWLRKRRLEKQRHKQLSKRHIQALKERAQKEIARVQREMGLAVGWGEEVSVRPPQGSPRSPEGESGGGPAKAV